MKIGMPYSGWRFSLAGLFQGLGVELVLPGSQLKKYLELGSQIAPQEWGLPLKIQLGSYITALEEGADVLVMTPSCSGCREDLNRHKQKELLRQAGYDFLAVDLELSWKGLFHALGKITNSKKKLKLIAGMKLGWQKAKLHAYVEENQLTLGATLTNYEQKCLEQIVDELLGRVFGEDLSLLRWEAEALFEVAQGRAATSVPKIGLVGDLISLFTIEPVFGVKKLLWSNGVQIVQPLRHDHWLLGQLGFSTKMERSMRKLASWELAGTTHGDLADEPHIWSQVGALAQCRQAKCTGVIQLVSCDFAGPSEDEMGLIAKKLGLPFFRLNLDEVADSEQVEVKVNAFLSLLNIKRNSVENLNSVIRL